MAQSNSEKFFAFKELDLPLGQYVISGSGPMGIRNIKAIGDIDIIVTQKLWKILSEKYEVSEEHGIKKIVHKKNENFCHKFLCFMFLIMFIHLVKKLFQSIFLRLKPLTWHKFMGFSS